jgi:small-conductance mechanosensitive channel
VGIVDFEINDLLGDLGAIGVAVIAAAIGVAIHWLVYRLASSITSRTDSTIDEFVLHRTRNPVRLLIILGTILVSTVFMGQEARQFAIQALIFVGIIALGWLVVSLTLVGVDVYLSRYPPADEADLEGRQARTQISVLQRFGAIIIWLIAIAIALLTIPGVAPLAASLLAGAGVLGIVLGVAAGPIIGNFIAGIQIAFTHPIKIGDVVIINGEWGRIGEITSTYVVLYIWDKRRLIVPLSKIVNEPIENWTRKTTDILGTVAIYTDYRAPVDEMRTELKRILDESGIWDGDAWSVLVTGADDRSMKVRALFSAPDSSVRWDLQCLVREKLIAFLREQHPEALPVAREIQHPASEAA